MFLHKLSKLTRRSKIAGVDKTSILRSDTKQKAEFSFRLLTIGALAFLANLVGNNCGLQKP